MTIREYFRARSKRTRMLLGVGGLIVVVAVAVALLAVTDHLSSVYCYPATAVAVLGVAIMFGGLLYLDSTKCPQCLARLGIHVANQYRFGRRVGYCPYCGVGFDKCEIRNP